MKDAKLGWGCLSESKLREIMQLHEVHEDLSDRTLVIARMQASNLLDHILKAMTQSAERKVVEGAPGRPSDRVLFLVGHDTNIATVAGALGMNWIVDGRPDGTPPGGSLIFELWRTHGAGYSVRIYYMAQTLQQMRETQVLTSMNPPQRLPLFVSGCSQADMSCTLDGFVRVVQRTIDPGFVAGN